MGCAGSRPSQLLPSLGNHHHHHHHRHTDSPQKGFILFNAKTIEFLQANELDIKEKLKQRCEQKLAKAIPQSNSSKSLLNNAKRTLLFNSNSASSAAPAAPASPESAATQAVETTEAAKPNGGVKQTKSDISIALNSSMNCNLKSTAIDAAVDYVLKYALNDFDIENFKSSNHLSMKQIRKDIMKKNNSVSSLSKMNNSISMNTNVPATTTTTTGTITTNSKNTATLSHKSAGYDASFYKQALNVAIDEFGLFVQENFIVINEYEKSCEEKRSDEQTQAHEGKEGTPEEAEALKLKEALEVARHNFYKGKISMVCLTKAGGYVVKEVKDQVGGEAEGAVLLTNGNESKSEVIKAEEVKPAIPQINIQDADATEKRLEDIKNEELRRVELLLRKAFEDKHALTAAEFLSVKTDLMRLLNSSIGSIVSFTKQQETQTPPADEGGSLKISLEKSKRVIELLAALNEAEMEQVDEKLVEAVLNLDHVNKEFKKYLSALEAKSSEADQQKSPGTSDINELSAEIAALNERLPRVLFASKSLPHPSSNAHKEQPQLEAKKVAEMPCGSIDIKKEIAFCILNVGEVLAKTIDYYSNDPSTEEIKDLIELSKSKSKQQIAETKLPNSASDSVVSPITSTSVSVDSITTLPGAKVDVSSPRKEAPIPEALPAEPSTPVPPPELKMESAQLPAQLLETNNATPQQEEPKQMDVSVEKRLEELVEGNSEESEEDFKRLEQAEEKSTEDEPVNLKSEVKSSSSSSDILSQEDEVVLNTVQVTAVDIEPIENRGELREPSIPKEVDSNPVIFRNGESMTETGQMNKRMSLDEELFYNLIEVDKKVKYMNDTCSENEGEGDDDDDLDDENFDYDESVELENANDERLFHPRTPAKIKSEVRSNRTVDLQEEIKQISNVIQDLVQTINVRNSTHTTSDKSPTEKSSLDNSDNNNVDSEDGSQNSGSGGDYKTKPYHYNRNSNGSHNSGNIADRKSINSRRSVGNQSLNSSIPISVSRKAALKKSMENEGDLINSNSNNGSFIDFSEAPGTPEISSLNSSNVNKSASSQRFRSKLPVKK